MRARVEPIRLLFFPNYVSIVVLLMFGLHEIQSEVVLVVLQFSSLVQLLLTLLDSLVDVDRLY